MNYNIDMHTHSIASGHAFSTLIEMVKYAKLNQIKMFALTDHGPAMPGSQTKIYFELLPYLQDSYLGIRILKGIEANILNKNGDLDLEDKFLKKMDIVIASFHDACIIPLSIEENTEIILKVIKNPFVDILGHLGNEAFKVDYERVVKAAKENNKLIEINNHSFAARKGSIVNCENIAKLCRNYEVKVTCGSDSHIAFDIGNLDEAERLLQKINMPPNLILNSSMSNVYEYLEEKKTRIDTIDKCSKDSVVNDISVCIENYRA